MKLCLLILFFFAQSVWATNVENIEINCWNKTVDGDGSFLCLYVIAIAKKNYTPNSVYVTEVAAPDGDGPKGAEQALRVCQSMGFPYVSKFEIQFSDQAKEMALLDANLGAGELVTTKGFYLQNVNCR